MKSLYYATFERGVSPAIKLFIKKQDKRAFIKTVYDDAILFFGDESFKQKAGCFKSLYIVLDSTKRLGVGSINAEMKHLLERKDLKITFPSNISTFKLSVLSECKNVVVDDRLKNAVEIMLKKVTKKGISYNSFNAELVIYSRSDGQCLFMKKVFFDSSLTRFESKFDLNYDLAFIMNFLSEPANKETVVDPFSKLGKIPYIRALCFKPATIIANDSDFDNVVELKKRAKVLKDCRFSVMNYEFLSSKFPIKFIDKVVTVLDDDFSYHRTLTDELDENFFDKLFENKVKIVVVMANKNNDISRAIEGKFNVEMMLSMNRNCIYKLKLI